MLERLIHDLTLEGSIIQRDSDDGPFVITVYEGRRLDPPVRLFVTAEDFDAHLRVMADGDVQEVFPDVEPIIAAYPEPIRGSYRQIRPSSDRFCR